MIQKSVRGILWLSTIFCTLAGTVQAEETPVAKGVVTEYGVSANLPSKWKQWDHTDDGDGWQSTTYLGFYGFSAAGVTLSGGQWPTAMSFEEFADWYHPSNPAVTVTGRQTVSINGRQYVELTGTYNDGKHDMVLLLYVTINGSQGNNFQFFANPNVFETVKPEFLQVIHSVTYH